MANIETALPFTLTNEGGYVNNPHDHGGPTNFGITQADFSQYLGRSASASDVENMTVAEAREIYRRHYWSCNKLDDVISQPMATCIFDMGVLCGTNRAAKWAQQVVGCVPDGKIGPVSLAALNSCDVATFVSRFANLAQTYFNDIASNHPTQHRFLHGWTERVNRLRKLAAVSPVIVPSPKPVAVSGDYATRLLHLAASVNCGNLGSRLLTFMHAAEPAIVTIFDVSRSANERRLHVINMAGNSVLSITCGVGAGSDPTNSGHASVFSNQEGSHCTSLGAFKYAETFQSSRHGLARRMDGLEATNSNLRSRAVITHTAAYVTDSHAGRSDGCQAIAESHHSIINQLNGSFGIIGKGSV